MVDARKRRFPKVLADQLGQALSATRPLGDECMVLLGRYRENQRKALAEGGLNPDFTGIGDGIPHQWVQAIMRLDEAFRALHKFRSSGGEEDYLSESVYRAAVQVGASEMGKRAADAKHDGPNGKRSAKERIREIWASGKYSSRDLCAEEECAALDISFSTARKALIGTTDPT